MKEGASMRIALRAVAQISIDMSFSHGLFAAGLQEVPLRVH